jgi:hypothetical protein
MGKEQNIKRINTKSSVEATDYIPGTNTPTNSKLVIKKVMIIKKDKDDDREREQNRRNSNNLPSRFRRGGCKRCGRTNVLLNLDTGLCFDCFLEQVISEVKEDIKNNGLEETRKA